LFKLGLLLFDQAAQTGNLLAKNARRFVMRALQQQGVDFSADSFERAHILGYRHGEFGQAPGPFVEFLEQAGVFRAEPGAAIVIELALARSSHSAKFEQFGAAHEACGSSTFGFARVRMASTQRKPRLSLRAPGTKKRRTDDQRLSGVD
jgi:hypothetical protein